MLQRDWAITVIVIGIFSPCKLETSTTQLDVNCHNVIVSKFRLCRKFFWIYYHKSTVSFALTNTNIS